MWWSASRARKSAGLICMSSVPWLVTVTRIATRSRGAVAVDGELIVDLAEPDGPPFGAIVVDGDDRRRTTGHGATDQCRARDHQRVRFDAHKRQNRLHARHQLQL